MSESSAKTQVLETLSQLPPDATVEEAMERLYFLAKIERGMGNRTSCGTSRTGSRIRWEMRTSESERSVSLATASQSITLYAQDGGHIFCTPGAEQLRETARGMR